MNTLSVQKQNDWSPIPPPKLNGGLYTGQSFIKDAPWANIYVHPSSAYMTNINLRSAGPPISALFQMNVGYRPGNNSDTIIEGINTFIGNENFGPFNFRCIPCFEKEAEITNPLCKTRIIPIM